MKCAMCKRGITKPGVTSVLLTRDDFTLVMREVLQRSVKSVAKIRLTGKFRKTSTTWLKKCEIRERSSMSGNIRLIRMFFARLRDRGFLTQPPSSPPPNKRLNCHQMGIVGITPKRTVYSKEMYCREI